MAMALGTLVQETCIVRGVCEDTDTHVHHVRSNLIKRHHSICVGVIHARAPSL